MHFCNHLLFWMDILLLFIDYSGGQGPFGQIEQLLGLFY